jgi:hypothetical protein
MGAGLVAMLRQVYSKPGLPLFFSYDVKPSTQLPFSSSVIPNKNNSRKPGPSISLESIGQPPMRDIKALRDCKVVAISAA